MRRIEGRLVVVEKHRRPSLRHLSPPMLRGHLFLRVGERLVERRIGVGSFVERLWRSFEV